jgi:hypothetical protein
MRPAGRVSCGMMLGRCLLILKTANGCNYTGAANNPEHCALCHACGLLVHRSDKRWFCRVCCAWYGRGCPAIEMIPLFLVWSSSRGMHCMWCMISWEAHLIERLWTVGAGGLGSRGLAAQEVGEEGRLEEAGWGAFSLELVTNLLGQGIPLLNHCYHVN